MDMIGNKWSIYYQSKPVMMSDGKKLLSGWLVNSEKNYHSPQIKNNILKKI